MRGTINLNGRDSLTANSPVVSGYTAAVVRMLESRRVNVPLKGQPMRLGPSLWVLRWYAQPTAGVKKGFASVKAWPIKWAPPRMRPGIWIYSPMVGILTPGRYINERGAVARVGSEAASFGDSALVIHGSVGMGIVGDTVRTELRAAGVRFSEVEHSGYCGTDTVERLVVPAREGGYQVVIGVGGGRVLDVSKAVAEALDLPFVLVPTSPATCSASTTVIVDYTPEGAHIGGRPVQRPAAASLIDPELLAHAPDRLLVSGIVDALAKAVEVRSATARIPEPASSTRAAFALCDELEAMLFADAAAAVAAGADSAGHERGRVRELIAETSVLWPGLIGTLAGEQARLAAAHSVHNALTILPGSHASLHGELVGFGILVQHALAQDDEALERTAAWFAEIGCPADLEALGCGEYLTSAEARDRVLRRACGSAPMMAAFPDIDPSGLAAAMARANELSLSLTQVA